MPNGCRKREWDTPNSKANFAVTELVVEPLAEDELLMMTIRSHDQFNTTIYGLDDRYRGVYNERRVIFMNPADILRLGFEIGEVVDLYNNYGDKEREVHGFIIVSYDIPERCAATYYPETNVLVPIGCVADSSNQPTSKSIRLKLRKSALFNADFPA